MKKILSIASIVLLTGCFSAKLITPTQADVDRVQTKFSGYSLADLEHGKSLFEQNCGKCHGLKNPVSRNEEEWRKVVPRMVGKINKKKEVLDSKSQEDILKYLITMSGASKK